MVLEPGGAVPTDGGREKVSAVVAIVGSAEERNKVIFRPPWSVVQHAAVGELILIVRGFVPEMLP